MQAWNKNEKFLKMPDAFKSDHQLSGLRASPRASIASVSESGSTNNYISKLKLFSGYSTQKKKNQRVKKHLNSLLQQLDGKMVAHGRPTNVNQPRIHTY